MKKNLLLVCIIIALGFFKARAQNPGHTVKINPISALLSTGSVFYEQRISEKNSWQLGAAYMGLKLSDTRFSGFSVTPEYRYYPKGNALNGLYIGPFARYQNYTLKADENKGSYSSIGGGVLLGRQWTYGSGFVLDLFFGPSFNSGRVKADDGSDAPDVSEAIDGMGIRTGILIGFGF